MKVLLMLSFMISVPAVQETAGNQSRGLLLRAYAEPVEQGLEAQYQVIDDFSQTVFDECITGKANSDN